MDNIKVKDLQNNTEVSVPFDSVGPLIQSGRYEMPIGKSVPIMDKDGQIGQIPSEHYAEALKNGYVPATSVDLQKKVDIDTYGDSPLQTGLERAASTASFGLSDFIASKVAPHYAEEMAKREEYNPAAAITGDIAGVVGPALLSGGLTAAAKAAQSGTSLLAKTASPILKTAAGAAEIASAPMKAAEALGAKTTAKVAEMLPSNGLAAKIVQEMIPRAAGMGVEGALYGAGNALSDLSLGNIDNTAESVLGEIGLSAFLGAGLGATFGAIKSATKPVLAKLEGLADIEKLAKEYTGTETGKASKIYDKGIKPKEVADLLVNENKIGIKALDDSETVMGKFDAYKEKVGKSIGDTLETIKNKGEDILPTNQEFTNKINDTLNKIESEFTKNGKALPGYTDFVNKIGNIRKEFEDIYSTMGSKQKIGVDELNSMRQKVDALARFDRNVPGDADKIQIFRELRKPLREIIDEVATKASPDLAASLKSANRDYHLLSSVEDALEKKLNKPSLSIWNVRDIATMALGHATGIGALANSLTALRQLADTRIAKNVQLIYGLKYAENNIAKSINDGIHKFFIEPAKVAASASYTLPRIKNDNNQSAFDRYASNLRKYADNTELYLEHVNAKHTAISRQIPNIVGNIESKGLNAVQFLNSKLPGRSSPDGAIPKGFKPSTQQLAKFARYAEIVENPKMAMERLKNGTLTKENVEALKAVYPEVYKQVVFAASNYMDKYGSKLPYNKKLQLGLILGVPTDSSMTPKFLRNLQVGYSQNMQQNSTINSTLGGMKQLDKANRLMGKPGK